MFTALPLLQDLLKAQPTPAQMEAGNYPKRKVAWNGLTISIENERGSVRRGADRHGKTWSTTMRHAYGYLKGSQGVDGDQVDCYLGPKLKSAPMVYVVHQRKTGDWERYDEDKCMLGFPDEAAAKRAFLAHYDDPRFLGPITALPVEEFVAKVRATAEQPRMLKALRAMWKVRRDGVSQRYRVNIDAGLPSGGHDKVVVVARGDELDELVARYAQDRHPLRKAAEEWYRAHLQRRVAHRHDIGEVRFSKKGRDEFAAFSADEDKLRLVVTLWEVVLRGQHVRREPVDHPRADGIVAFHVIDAPVMLGNERHLVRVEVGEDENGRLFYDLFKDAQAHEERKAAKRSNLEPKSKPPLDLPSGASTASDLTVPRPLIKSSSASLLLLLPSGQRCFILPGDYTWADAPLLAKALGPGERWITVHPHGPDEKGVPVLIKETTQGSGVYHVIGGAGGKLNYMRIRPKAPDETLKDSIAARRKAKQEQRKAQAKRDKELGLDQAKKGAKEQIQLKEQAEERTFITTVAQAMNWQAADLEPKIPDHLSDKAQERLRQQHHADLLKRAHAVVDLQRQHLATDAEARATALEATDLAAAALDDTAPAAKKGLGFAAQYAERAQAQGLSDEELQREAEARKEERRQNLSDGQREAIRKRGDASKALKAEIDTLREPVLSAQVKASLAEAKQGAELIKAQVKLQEVKKQARAVRQDIDRATEVKAWNLDVAKAEEHLDDQVRAAVENDVRTLSTRAFLGKVQAAAGGDAAVQLRQHVSAGAFNSINALAITAGGAALVDRSVVDVLGVAGAAQVLARRLHADLPAADVERLTEGLTAFHQAHYLEASSEALREADSLLDAAKEAELGEAHYGDEFAALQQLNQRRKDAVEAANQILATRLGEFEANAALEVALKAGRRDEPLEVPLGGLSDEDAIRQARAIGLQRGDYQLNKVAGQQVLTVTPAGLDRLAQPVDSAELTRLQRTLDIIEGRHDEPDWLPAGFAKRPDLALEVPPGVAPSLAQRFDPAGAGGDLTQAVKDYIGGRAADGDSPADILADLHSADFVRKAGDAAGYQAALDAVAPLKDAQGKLRRAEDLTPAFEALADDYVQRRFGDRLAPVHRQSFALDQTAAEALHRALAQEPAGTAAYKAIGDLTGDDQRTLREWFYQQIAKESPEAGALRQRLEALEQAEPDKESVDMFGDRVTNPEWQSWQGQRDTLAAEVGQASLNWNDYTQMLHGHVNAYAAIQDLIRSDTSRAFADAYNRLNPAAPLKLGRQTIRNNLNHLDAVDPEARTARLAQTRELIDRLRERNQGRYAEGAVSDKLDEARARQEALAQSQMGFFSSEETADGDLFGVAGGGDLFGAQADMFGAAPAQPASQPLKADERHTLGQVAERQIAALMPTVGGQFKSGRPVKLYQPTMSGTVDSPEAMRQRAIKLVAENKRLALAAGTGAGKTAMSLGAFTHLQAQGKAQRGLFLVPSIVQGEFNAEALRFLDPGRFNWHAEPGASREERIAAYKDPAHHFAVMTHQSFRDDMLHLGAQHAGIEPGAMSEQLAAMSPPARADWLKGVMAKEGIRFDFLGVDEGHNTLNRQGKENSAMANVVDALAHQTPYYLHSTADPIKNDLSEAFDLLRKMDPARYTDQAAFLRRYGPDTAGAKQALQREMARYVLPFKIDPPVRADKREIRVDLSDGQRQALADLDKHLAKASLARKQGQVDVAALQALSPESFAGVPADQHEAVARDLSTSLGILKSTATRRIVDAHPESGKLGTVTRLAKERTGQPGVVFAHSLAAVERLKQALEADGHRVVTITGADSAEDKATKIKSFNPEQGERSTDIVVASDAGATGANLQSGQWLVQFDTPLTAMGHAQRQGRINRIGQKNNVELLDLVANHPSEDRARARLKTKYALREMLTTPLAGLDDTGLAAFLHQRRVAEGQASLF